MHSIIVECPKRLPRVVRAATRQFEIIKCHQFQMTAGCWLLSTGFDGETLKLTCHLNSHDTDSTLQSLPAQVAKEIRCSFCVNPEWSLDLHLGDGTWNSNTSKVYRMKMEHVMDSCQGGIRNEPPLSDVADGVNGRDWCVWS